MAFDIRDRWCENRWCENPFSHLRISSFVIPVALGVSSGGPILRILLSGYLIRYPVGGFSWHHLQYLAGFERMGHEVTYFEHFGWPDSCYDPQKNSVGPEAGYGLQYFRELLRSYGIRARWSYLAEDGSAHGMSRNELAEACRACDVYFNLSNINWIPELESCRRRVLVDTDPVFTQIKAHGLGGAFSNYHRLFTYGENVGRPGCTMPVENSQFSVFSSQSPGTAAEIENSELRAENSLLHHQWLPTRQPVVLDFWPVSVGDAGAPFTTVMNWSATGEHQYEGRVFGQKDRELQPLFDLPRRAQAPMELAINAPPDIRQRLSDGGWRLADPLEVTRTPARYQEYIRASRAEFTVAKHAYVVTRSGWFSDRSCGYLAMGRPVILQDTGFSNFLPVGKGLLGFQTPEEAVTAVEKIGKDYQEHCRAARDIAEEYFDSWKVLAELLHKGVES